MHEMATTEAVDRLRWGPDASCGIARLLTAIDRQASAAAGTLAAHPPLTDGSELLSELAAERRELRRQLGALRDSVSRAPSRSEGDRSLLHADLATLLSFAKTLRSDAETWRAALEAGLEEVARLEAAARRERQRLTAECEQLMRARDALQSRIDETARRIARDAGGEYRRTFPCFPLGEAATVCSLKVLCPRRGFHLEKRWLVTLDDAHDQVIIRRSYV